MDKKEKKSDWGDFHSLNTKSIHFNQEAATYWISLRGRTAWFSLQLRSVNTSLHWQSLKWSRAEPRPHVFLDRTASLPWMRRKHTNQSPTSTLDSLTALFRTSLPKTPWCLPPHPIPRAQCERSARDAALAHYHAASEAGHLPSPPLHSQDPGQGPSPPPLWVNQASPN